MAAALPDLPEPTVFPAGEDGNPTFRPVVPNPAFPDRKSLIEYPKYASHIVTELLPAPVAGADPEVDAFVAKLRAVGAECVAFDFDMTITLKHTSGCMYGITALDRFVSDKTGSAGVQEVSRDFIRVVPRLHAEGFKLAICSFTDASVARDMEVRRVTDPTEKPPVSSWVGGADLMRAVLMLHFPPQIRDAFLLIGALYDSKGKMHASKNWHVDQVVRHYQVPKAKVILFDDDKNNVQMAPIEGFMACAVEKRVAFQLSDLNLPELRKHMPKKA